jgi:hypothetical protein
MNPVTKIASALRAVTNHPLNHYRKSKVVAEYGFIQLQRD